MSVNAKAGEFSISTSLVGMSMDYREYDRESAILDSEKSDLHEMYGSELRFAYNEKQTQKSFFELGVNLQTVGGNTEYVGSLLGSKLGYGSYVGSTYNFIYDVSFDYIYNYAFENGFMIKAGMALGYRSWRRELSASQIELYTWYSLRPQLGLSYVVDKTQLSFLVEYQHGFETKMDILQNRENPRKSLDLGYANIVKISLPLTYSLSPSLDIFTSYVYEHQKIGASNSVKYIVDGATHDVYEPKSSANNHYLKLGATLKF